MATKSSKKATKKAKKATAKPKAKAAGAAGTRDISGPTNPSGSGNT